MKDQVLLSAKNLKKYFPLTRGVFSRTHAHVKAVDGVDLTVEKGQTIGLVGESGCGKSTLGLLLLRLQEPTEGEVLFEGRNILRYDKKTMRALRKEMQIIFQDPYSSLNPRKKVKTIIGESFLIHNMGNKKEMHQKVLELLEVVGIRPEHINRYPHEFSGGQRQRIGIARALILNPKLIICDEPVSALDVSIQAQILNLLQDLQEQFDLTYLFISHDLSVVKHISDHVLVMYLGRLVEKAQNELIYNNPKHPYTEALLSSTPVVDLSSIKEKVILHGDVPSPINPPEGCHFHTRCPKVMPLCRQEIPEFTEIEDGHSVRCFLYT